MFELKRMLETSHCYFKENWIQNHLQICNYQIFDLIYF